MKVRNYAILIVALFIVVNFAEKYSDKLGVVLNRQPTEEEKYYGGLEVVRVSGEYSQIDEGVKFPKITAKSYIVADMDTGEIIESKNADEIYPIASLTKLITAMVSIETIDQYSPININRQAIDTYGKQGNLRNGEILTANELLYPLLLESSNDAAEALAIFAGRDAFIKNMNDKMVSIGMYNTKFEDASGLSQKNFSTAMELFGIVQYIEKNYPEIFKITDKQSHRIGRRVWNSNSRFRTDKYYIGGKNGYTDEALLTLIANFELPLSVGENKNRRISIILLQSTKVEKDTRDILFYLLRNIEHTPVW